MESSIFTFEVDKVQVCTEQPLLVTAEKMLRNNLELSSTLEDWSHKNDNHEKFASGELNGLIHAIHTAYHSHYPLKLSVNDFMILISQGLGKHISENAEKLRENFVDHIGKEIISISRNEFVLGGQNDWSTVFEEFANQIKKRTKKNLYDIVVDDTSIATPTSKIVSEIALMDCMKSYFKYEVSTFCGIPEIILVGSKDDWENLKMKVRKLSEMNKDDCLQIKWWLIKLIPIIDTICNTAIKKEVSKAFWSNIYKHFHVGSGSSEISGWITVFFPYLARGKNDFKTSISPRQLPVQYSKVPFIWNYFGQEIRMTFFGGFLGALYDKQTNTIEAAHFWSVMREDDKKSLRPDKDVRSLCF